MILSKIFVVLMALVVIALAALFIVPSYWDWSQYRSQFESQASAILKTPVKVTGDTKLRLLPTPKVLFSKVQIGATDGPLSASVERFEMDVEAAPLLKGEFRILDMKLVRPQIDMALDDGVLFDADLDASAGAGQGSLIEISKVVFEKINVLQGDIRIRDNAAGRVISLKSVDAVLSAKSVSGPWRAEGSAISHYLKDNAFEQAFDFKLNTGSVQDDGGFRTRINIAPADFPLIFEVNGDTYIEDGVPSLAGDFKISKATIVNAPAQEQISLSENRFFDFWEVDGVLDLSLDAITSEDFELRLADPVDPYKVRGTAEFDLTGSQQFNIKIDGEQADMKRFAQWLPQQKVQSFSQQAEVVSAFLNKIPPFHGNGSVSLNLPAIVLNSGVVRNVVIDASPLSGQSDEATNWQIKTFQADLAGRTQLRASGLLKSKDGLDFSGSMVVASNQPSGFANLFRDQIDPAIRDLNRAGLAADVILSSNKVSLKNMELDLDGSLLKGSIEKLDGSGQQQLDVQLVGDILNVDAVNALWALFVDDSADVPQNLSAEIKVKGLEFAGTRTGKVESVFAIENNLVQLEKLRVENLEGLQVIAAGELGDWRQVNTIDLQLELSGDTLAPALSKFWSFAPKTKLVKHLIENPDLTSNSSLKLTFQQDNVSNQESSARALPDLQIRGAGVIGGTQFSLLSQMNNSAQKWTKSPVNIDLRLNQDNLLQFFKQLNWPVETAILERRAAHADIKLEGSFATGLKTNLSVRSGQDTLTGQGALTLPSVYDFQQSLSEQLIVDQQIDFDSKDLNLYTLMFGMVMPDQFLGFPTSLSGRLILEDNLFSLRDAKGSLGRSNWSGEVQLNPKSRRPKISGAIAIDHMSVPELSRYILGTGITLESFILRQSGPFGENLLDWINADLKIEAETFDLGLLKTARNARVTLGLNDGALAFEDLNATYGFDGNVSGGISLTQTAGQASVEARAQFSGVKLADLKSPTWSMIDGYGDLAFEFQGTGRSPAQVIGEMTGSGAFKIEDLSIPGLNTNGLGQIFKWVDGFDEPPVGAALDQRVAQELGHGSIKSKLTEFPFSIAAGSIRANNIRLQDENAELIADASFDLVAGTAFVDASLNFKKGFEPVTGASPEIDILWQGKLNELNQSFSSRSLSAFLGLRAFEREQRRVELLQARILEQQRLRREVRYYQDLIAKRAQEKNQEIKRHQVEETGLEDNSSNQSSNELNGQVSNSNRPIGLENLQESNLPPLENLEFQALPEIFSNQSDGLIQ